jgi:hypothetical protein
VLRRIFGPKSDEVVRCTTSSFITVLFVIYNLNDQIIGDQMGRTRSTYGEEEECMQDFREKSRKKETTRKTLRYVGDNIVGYRPVSMQRPLNKQQDKSRC